VFTSNLISQTTWLKVKLKLVNFVNLYCPIPDLDDGQGHKLFSNCKLKAKMCMLSGRLREFISKLKDSLYLCKCLNCHAEGLSLTKKPNG